MLCEKLAYPLRAPLLTSLYPSTQYVAPIASFNSTIMSRVRRNGPVLGGGGGVMALEGGNHWIIAESE